MLRGLRWIQVLVLAMAATSVSVEDSMGKAISNEILGSPVHIFLKTEKGSTSQGTGFYFVAGGAMYLVTAKHVVEIGLSPDGATHTIPNSDMELLSYSNDAQTRIVMLANLTTLRQNGDVKQNDSRDAVVIKIGVMAGGMRRELFIPAASL